MSRCEFLTNASLAMCISQANSHISKIHSRSKGINLLQAQNAVFHHVPIDGCRQEFLSQPVSIFDHSFVLLNFSHINFGIKIVSNAL